MLLCNSLIYSNIILKDLIQSNKKVAFPAQNPCTTGKKYYDFGMETETIDLIKKFKAIDTAMDELAKKVEEQCKVHISDIEESMADYRSFYLGDN